MNQILDEPSYEECVQSLLFLAREIGGEGFHDMKENDLKEIIEPTTELTVAEIIDILNDEKSEDDMLEETVTEELVLKLASISKILNFIQNTIEE